MTCGSAGALSGAPTLRDSSGAGNVDYRAHEALDDSDVRCGSGAERREDLVVAVEVPAPVCVELRNRGGVVCELQPVHPPTAAVVAAVTRRGCCDVVRLHTEELVDRVEARVRSPRVREIRRRANG